MTTERSTSATGRTTAARTARLAQVGLGQWGQNLARNFDDLAELAWLCDVDDDRRGELAHRYPGARMTNDFDDVLRMVRRSLRRAELT